MAWLDFAPSDAGLEEFGVRHGIHSPSSRFETSAFLGGSLLARFGVMEFSQFLTQ
jgi:hypothetical protein